MKDLSKHLKTELKKGKKIVVVGDYNVAHTEIDVHDPVRLSKVSGFLPEERAWFNSFLELGFIDTFRHFHPNEPERYSWWDYRTLGRVSNRGWRIDYICVSENLRDQLKSADILDQVEGSDHCPGDGGVEMIFFALFAYPFLEIFAIVRFTEHYSFMDYLIWTFLSGMLGLALMSFVGLRSIFAAPDGRIGHRLLIFVGAFLLLLPGILSDITGVLLILPGIRHLLVWKFKKVALNSGPVFQFRFGRTYPFSGPGVREERDVRVIEAEVLESSSQKRHET